MSYICRIIKPIEIVLADKMSAISDVPINNIMLKYHCKALIALSVSAAAHLQASKEQLFMDAMTALNAF